MPLELVEDHPQGLTSPIQTGTIKHRKNRPTSPRSKSNSRASSEVQQVPGKQPKHNPEQQLNSTSRNDKMKQESSDVNVLDRISQQLKVSVVTDDTHGGVGAGGKDDALYIIKNMSSVDDCLKLKQMRREERLKRRAEQQLKQETSPDEPAVSIPVPRKDLFTSEFNKERAERELQQKLLRKEQKAKEQKLKEQKIAKTNKLAKARALAAENRPPSPPKANFKKVLPAIKPAASATKSTSDTFKLPEQVLSNKFPISAKEMVFTLAAPSVLPSTASQFDAQSSFMDFEAGNSARSLLMEDFPSVNQSFASSHVKSKPISKQPTKPTAMATEYVDKQQLWALQVEAKKMKARKENEDRELGELRQVPDVKKARESWVHLKKVETKKAGAEWPAKKEQVPDEEAADSGSNRTDPLTSGHREEQVITSGREETDTDDGGDEVKPPPTPTPATSDQDGAGSTGASVTEDTSEEQSQHLLDTAVMDMTTADNMADIMDDTGNENGHNTDKDALRENSVDPGFEDVIEGEDGFEDDDGGDFPGANNSSVFGSTTFASVAGNHTAASEFGYDDQFFATTSVVKAGASLVMPDGEVIGGCAYEHPLQTNKNDSVYTTPASPLKKVVGDEDVPFDTDRFEDTERSTYDTPKGIFGRENPPTSVRGAAYRWEDSDDDDEEFGTASKGPVATGRSNVMDTGRSGMAMDTGRSDCSDYEDEWEFTGLPENNNRTARGSEGVWRRKTGH
mmetsp:Transcript_909/g.1578  ORF Transcript_909/g.1578 Transcript_909/m.1578 type:complete len:736 (+) Transcript_909:161-2368(+)